MNEYDLLWLVPYDIADDVRKAKPDSVDELTYKSADWVNYAIFGLTLLQHLEWFVQMYGPIKSKKTNTDREIKLIKYDDHTEIDIKNYDPTEITPELIKGLYDSREDN